MGEIISFEAVISEWYPHFLLAIESFGAGAKFGGGTSEVCDKALVQKYFVKSFACHSNRAYIGLLKGGEKAAFKA